MKIWIEKVALNYCFFAFGISFSVPHENTGNIIPKRSLQKMPRAFLTVIRPSYRITRNNGIEMCNGRFNIMDDVLKTGLMGYSQNIERIQSTSEALEIIKRCNEQGQMLAVSSIFYHLKNILQYTDVRSLNELFLKRI